MVYHVLNRGNGRLRIFHKPGDYQAFLDLLVLGKERANIELFGFCLMPNHWHLVLRPRREGDMAAYLSWVSNTHVKRYRSYCPRSSGHLYQGRYKSFPVQEDPHFLSLLRYVEANPLRAKQKLVSRAQNWEWSSLGCDGRTRAELLSPWPVRRPPDWMKIVNRPLPDAERERIKTSLERGRPLGDDRWTTDMARRLGLQFTLNLRGRPRMQAENGGTQGE
jgi:putative transposase